jgi:hypothetical protein
MEVLYPRCAGLDVHAKTVVACVRIASGATVTYAHRTVSTNTRGLLELADWLTCFPGFAVVAAGNAPTSPETVTARCGTLTAESGVRLRWPDGELTTALASAPTGLGRAC